MLSYHKNVRCQNTKSMYTSSPIYSFKPIYSCHSPIQKRNPTKNRTFSRSCLYVSIQDRCLFHEHCSRTRRPTGANHSFCVAFPGYSSNTTTHTRRIPYQRRSSSNSLSRLRNRVRASQKGFSSVLLDMEHIEHLVLGPGGMGFFALLGAYCRLEHQLVSLKEISGSSAGAILALFLGVGMSSQEILDASLDVNIKELAKYNIKSFVDKYGLIDHSQIKETLVTICQGDPTFAELKRKVYIAAFNVNHGKTIYFSKDTHPDMSVIDAVCMSISVPFLFSSFQWNNELYIDGGTMESYPANPFLDKPKHKVLVIKLLTSNSSTTITSLKDFVNSLIHFTLKNRQSYDTMFHVLTLDTSHVNIFDFNMSNDDKLKLFFYVQL